ncbi:MAG TPA: hypothetical protein VGS80_14505 [Ktedonobacterales bacterium]|nr:hypothetical protein [Ktedonobacterales bacterium]
MLRPFLVDLSPSRPLKQPIDDWWPDFPRVPSPRPTQVELRLPHGTTRTVACRFGHIHVNWGLANWRSDKPPGFKPPWVVTCELPSLSREDVPPGTEVWYETVT